MRSRGYTGSLTALLLAAFFAGPAMAQRDDNERDSSRWAGLMNVDLMVNTYTRFLARKYDLTEEQDEYTREFLRAKAQTFMDGHREELMGLVERMFDARTGGEMSQAELIDWGKRVMPVYEEAKRIIVDGNSEWRDILTEDQKRIHDEDLALMAQSFQTTEDQLHRIVVGQMTVDEFRKPMRAQRPTPRTVRAQRRAVETPAGEPQTAAQIAGGGQVNGDGIVRNMEEDDGGSTQSGASETDPEAAARAARIAQLQAQRMQRDQEQRGQGGASAGNAPPQPRQPRTVTRRGAAPSGKNFESEWEQYTRTFIQKYALNEGQEQRALAILKDCTEQAVRHTESSKTQVETIEAEIAKLGASEDKKAAAQKLLKWNEKLKDVREPINQIFERQLKPRLDKLPTRAQRAAAETKPNQPKKPR
jgi:hypothetical protein